MSGQVHSLALGRVIPRPRLQVCLPRIAEITLPFQRAAFTVSVQKQEKHHVLPPRYLLVTYCAHITCLGRSLPQGSVAAMAQARGRRALGGGATSRLLASGVSAEGPPGDTPRRGGPGPVPVTNDWPGLWPLPSAHEETPTRRMDKPHGSDNRRALETAFSSVNLL